MDRFIGRENVRHYRELNAAIGTLALMGGTNGHLTDGHLEQCRFRRVIGYQCR